MRAALFETFNSGTAANTTSVVALASYNASGDDWRSIEALSTLATIARDVCNGVELSDAIEKRVRDNRGRVRNR